MIDWVKNTWAATHPFSSGGVHLNFTGEEGAERVRAGYRGNYSRLMKIKKSYDPADFFS